VLDADIFLVRDSQNFTVELSLQLTQIAIDKITVRRRALCFAEAF